MNKYLLIFALALSFSTPVLSQSYFQAEYIGAPFDRFYVVSPGIYRGARPELAGLEFLAKLGVRTVINLDDDKAAIRAEVMQAKNFGIKVISIPLSSFFAPSDADIKKALQIMSDGSRGLIFVHCKHGEDRTGLVVALYRIEDHGWTAAAAREEMLSLGFHKILIGLNHYFKMRSGLDD